MLGHLFLWILFLQGADGEIISEYLILLILAKNATVHMLSSHRLAPRLFQLSAQSQAGWIMTRTFVSVRWTLPFLMSLLIVASLDATFGAAHALIWSILDIAGAFLAACVVTYTSEIRFKKYVR